MSLSATLFGTDSLIFKATNILGLGIPGLLHKTFGPGEPEAQRLGEISRQTAKEAEPRVIVWGRVRPIGGNLIHCQEPIKRMVKQSSSGGGKGGGSKKQEQKVEHVFRTYAIGVCEGPITGYSRIWRNNKLVYDARGNEWGVKNNPVFLRQYRLYLGGWNQMPDPTLESIWGAGQVPAYRGTAYIVSIDEDLTDMGGAVPQWQFEVERAEGVVVTSRPYAVETHEGLKSHAASARSGWHQYPPELTEEVASFQGDITGGVHRSIYITPIETAEEMQSYPGALISGVHKDILINYSDGDPEEMQSYPGALISGVHKDILINYSDGDPEEIQSYPAEIIGGVHNAP